MISQLTKIVQNQEKKTKITKIGTQSMNSKAMNHLIPLYELI